MEVQCSCVGREKKLRKSFRKELTKNKIYIYLKTYLFSKMSSLILIKWMTEVIVQTTGECQTIEY